MYYMKYLFLLLILVASITSCEHVELIYSCDPELNAIVKSATKEFSEITLNEFLEYDIVFQRAIYRSFTPEKMRAFWLEKLDLVKIGNSYIEEEQLHIQELTDQLDIEYFNLAELDTTELNNRLDFFKEWSEHASNSFNWSAKHIKYILYSLYVTEEQYDISQAERRENTLQSMSENCDCAGEADCDAVIGYSCVDGGCSTGLGCGPFWLTTCTGTCDIQ